MALVEISLAELTGNGAVRNLSGHDRGVAARQRFGLDRIDHDPETKVTVKVPEDLYTVSSSFFQGMFAESVRAAQTREAFLAKYLFDADTVILRQIEDGIDDSLMKRKSFMR